RISELMPRVAGHAGKLAVVRTVHHRHTQHNSGMYWSIVGRPYRVDNTLINPSRTDVPSFGTLVGWLAYRDGYSSPLPAYVITPAAVRCGHDAELFSAELVREGRGRQRPAEFGYSWHRGDHPRAAPSIILPRHFDLRRRCFDRLASCW